MPAGFDIGKPELPGLRLERYDAFVDRARTHGLKVFLTLAPPIPYWASEEPARCPHHIGGYQLHRALLHVEARSGALRAVRPRRRAPLRDSVAAGPHGGSVALYSLWNEPNLEHYLFPQTERTRNGRTVDAAAKRYRELWYEGWKAISVSDPPLRDKVLFGETAAISSPMDTLYRRALPRPATAGRSSAGYGGSRAASARASCRSAGSRSTRTTTTRAAPSSPLATRRTRSASPTSRACTA